MANCRQKSIGSTKKCPSRQCTFFSGSLEKHSPNCRILKKTCPKCKGTLTRHRQGCEYPYNPNTKLDVATHLSRCSKSTSSEDIECEIAVLMFKLFDGEMPFTDPIADYSVASDRLVVATTALSSKNAELSALQKKAESLNHTALEMKETVEKAYANLEKARDALKAAESAYYTCFPESYLVNTELTKTLYDIQSCIAAQKILEQDLDTKEKYANACKEAMVRSF